VATSIAFQRKSGYWCPLIIFFVFKENTLQAVLESVKKKEIFDPPLNLSATSLIQVSSCL
jgi:hypothetical protein